MAESAGRAGLGKLALCEVAGTSVAVDEDAETASVRSSGSGAEEAGFATACWTSLLVQQWIEREFGVLYNRHYVCELLHNLNFSYQKARFISEHLDAEARQEWLAHTWPEVLRLAQQKEAWILFGDEVSFAQWGSLGYTWAPCRSTTDRQDLGETQRLQSLWRHRVLLRAVLLACAN